MKVGTRDDFRLTAIGSLSLAPFPQTSTHQVIKNNYSFVRRGADPPNLRNEHPVTEEREKKLQ